MDSFNFGSLVRQANFQICGRSVLTNYSLPHKLTSRLKKITEFVKPMLYSMYIKQVGQTLD